MDFIILTLNCGRPQTYVHVPTPKTWEYHLYTEIVFQDMSKDLKIMRLCWVIWVAPVTCNLIKKRFEDINRREDIVILKAL